MKENSALGRTWAQARQELFTPQENAASDLRVDVMRTLIAERKSRGLTQKKLSEMAGVRQPIISRIERGDTAPQIDTLIKLFAAMDMKMQFVPINS